MTIVMTGLSTSLDGFIAGPDDGPGNPLGDGGERLFDWYFDGDTPSRLHPTFKLSPQSAAFFDEFASRVGAVISGRRTYEIANAWGGHGPLPGAPLFVMTHEAPASIPEQAAGDPPYEFVAGGIEQAVALARDAAGERDLSLMGSAAVQQALRAGLLDLLAIHLVPIVLGGGVRLLDGLAPIAASTAFELERAVDAPGVTHLLYRVVR
jgi:dihydrofolate reductase